MARQWHCIYNTHADGEGISNKGNKYIQEREKDGLG